MLSRLRLDVEDQERELYKYFDGSALEANTSFWKDFTISSHPISDFFRPT